MTTNAADERNLAVTAHIRTAEVPTGVLDPAGRCGTHFVEGAGHLLPVELPTDYADDVGEWLRRALRERTRPSTHDEAVVVGVNSLLALQPFSHV